MARRHSPYRLASYAALVKVPGDPRSLENRHKGVMVGERAGTGRAWVSTALSAQKMLPLHIKAALWADLGDSGVTAGL